LISDSSGIWTRGRLARLRGSLATRGGLRRSAGQIPASPPKKCHFCLPGKGGFLLAASGLWYDYPDRIRIRIPTPVCAPARNDGENSVKKSLTKPLSWSINISTPSDKLVNTGGPFMRKPDVNGIMCPSMRWEMRMGFAMPV